MLGASQFCFSLQGMVGEGVTERNGEREREREREKLLIDWLIRSRCMHIQIMQCSTNDSSPTLLKYLELTMIMTENEKEQNHTRS